MSSVSAMVSTDGGAGCGERQKEGETLHYIPVLISCGLQGRASAPCLVAAIARTSTTIALPFHNRHSTRAFIHCSALEEVANTKLNVGATDCCNGSCIQSPWAREADLH